jgi:hypothetical protein
MEHMCIRYVNLTDRSVVFECLGKKHNNVYPFSVHVVTFNFITNLMHLFIKNYHNSHLKFHTLKISVMHN